MSHPELDPRDAEIARLKEQLRCMRSREEMAIQLLQNIAEALGYEVCENPQFLAPEIAGLVKRLGDMKQQLAAAESALTAEQALSEQMRAALAAFVESHFIQASCAMSYKGCSHIALLEKGREALALTPTDALKARLLEVAEKAYNEGWLRDAFWQASETRRALEEGK